MHHSPEEGEEQRLRTVDARRALRSDVTAGTHPPGVPLAMSCQLIDTHDARPLTGAHQETIIRHTVDDRLYKLYLSCDADHLTRDLGDCTQPAVRRAPARPRDTPSRVGDDTLP
ncbi:hypothetical protein GCM10023328_42420 [Modestobacter marinus]|uniref:Transposase n=1 Tax=Modestobacter marinus TaxID=477641 RepID=A0ABQ2FV76_9ACTN|nr:hypothetical protein GCM10011589_11770 [Modestobacter marinus]